MKEKKLVVTLVLETFLLFFGFLSHFSNLEYMDSWTFRVGESSKLWSEHGGCQLYHFCVFTVTLINHPGLLISYL